jgi:hypothetical protein
MIKRGFKFAFVAISTLNAISAIAATDFSLFSTEVSISGFGTAGYAISNQSYKYERFIDNDGTFKRDSVLGGQIDIKLNNEFSITAQAKLAPALDSDKEINPILTWAFLSWRPTNDLLFRGGRIRLPLYLNSQNTDIGATFDFARLPSEVYATAPITDVNGLSAAKTWNFGENELTLEGYAGTVDAHFRQPAFNYSPLPPSESLYIPASSKLYGLALTFQHENNVFHVSAFDTYTKLHIRFTPSDFPFVPIMEGVGYYKFSNELPGSKIPETDVIHTPIYTVGVDLDVGNDFRIMSEYVRRNVRHMKTGSDSYGGYFAVLKKIDDWTPYVSVAHLRSTNKVLNLYNNLINNVVPDFIPDADILNAGQRSAAAFIESYDQTTWAVGTSYQINPTSKLKAEWAITDVGNVSSFVDAPTNEFSGNRLINVFSFSYNVVF